MTSELTCELDGGRRAVVISSGIITSQAEAERMAWIAKRKKRYLVCYDDDNDVDDGDSDQERPKCQNDHRPRVALVVTRSEGHWGARDISD